MRRKFWIGFSFIVATIALAIYISLPSTSSFLGRNVEIRQGLDLQGGVRLVYQLDLSDTEPEDVNSAIQSTRDVIERRVFVTGAVEPTIVPGRLGDEHTVIVELPGITDVQDAIDLIGRTAQLEFKELGGAGEEVEWIPTGLTGRDLQRASPGVDPPPGGPYIALKFTREGGKLFEEITGRNIGQPIATFLDDEFLQSATVQERISGGEGRITGQFTTLEVRELVNLLNAGALDVPIELVEQRTVGATLGTDSVKTSLVAGLVGLILIALFMIINYRVAGLAAVIALVGYTAIVVALFKFIPVTLTLAGIAGFILSIGMAIDANVLIFERLREELRQGRDLNIAMEEAFRRSWPSVRDSNVATIMTSLILYFTTTGLVRGFGITLAIGTIVSLYSSITASRAFLRLFAMSKFLRRDLERI